MNPKAFSFDVDALPPLREVIAQHNLRAEKSLGQNFLLDQNITDKIVRYAGDFEGASAIEIGPGPGGLTRSLLKSEAAHVVAVEFDSRAVEALAGLKNAAHGRLEILQQDALKADLTQLCAAPRKIVANLPYNIATPLLIGWLKQIYEDRQSYQSMTLMFQKEVAQRIVAQPNTKAYGRLSVISQWLCDARIVYDLPPSAFTPPPKVTSSVVHFVPKDLKGEQPSFEAMERILAIAFGQRRKMLRSSMKEYVSILNDLEIEGTRRAETLSLEDYLKIAVQSGL